MSSASIAATVDPAGTLRGCPLTRICTVEHLKKGCEIVGGAVFRRQAGGGLLKVDFLAKRREKPVRPSPPVGLAARFPGRANDVVRGELPGRSVSHPSPR